MNKEEIDPISKMELKVLPLNHGLLTETEGSELERVTLIKSELHQTHLHRSFHYYKLIARHCPSYEIINGQ